MKNLAENQQEEESESEVEIMDSSDPDYKPKDQPHLLDQSELNDLIRDLGLDKERSELLASRMLQWRL